MVYNKGDNGRKANNGLSHHFAKVTRLIPGVGSSPTSSAHDIKKEKDDAFREP